VAVGFGALQASVSKGYGIIIGLRNDGRTKATVKDVLVKFDYNGSLAQGPDYTLPEPDNFRTLDTILSAQNDIWYLNIPFFFDQIKEPFCFGYVRYEDVFMRKWTCRFAVKIHPTKIGTERCPSAGPSSYHEETEGWDI
jgi:hypothetical protein